MTENENLFATDTVEEETPATKAEETPAAEAEEVIEETVTEESVESEADFEEVSELIDEASASEEISASESAAPKKMSKGAKIAIQAVAAVLVCIIVSALTIYFTPRVKYVWAVHLAENGKTDKAYDILTEISGSYKKAELELKRFVNECAEQTYAQDGGTAQKATVKCETGKNYFKQTVDISGQTQTIEKFYDNDGNVIKEVQKDASGSEQTTETTYDKNGNIIKETTSVKSGNTTYKTELNSKNYKRYYIKRK